MKEISLSGGPSLWNGGRHESNQTLANHNSAMGPRISALPCLVLTHSQNNKTHTYQPQEDHQLLPGAARYQRLSRFTEKMWPANRGESGSHGESNFAKNFSGNDSASPQSRASRLGQNLPREEFRDRGPQVASSGGGLPRPAQQPSTTSELFLGLTTF